MHSRTALKLSILFHGDHQHLMIKLYALRTPCTWNSIGARVECGSTLSTIVRQMRRTRWQFVLPIDSAPIFLRNWCDLPFCFTRAFARIGLYPTWGCCTWPNFLSTQRRRLSKALTWSSYMDVILCVYPK